MKGLYIITGASRGIGLAVATRLLETGNTVVGVSRTPSPLADAPGFRQVQGSVTDPEGIEPLFETVRHALDGDSHDLLCLLNNAAVLDPLLPIEQCPVEEIRRHVEVNLTAPIVLTSRFMARFGDLQMRKKVVFMTSGAAHSAMPDMALYCGTKAGLSMFCECVGSEQEGQAGGFEVAAISPGMVETDMQKIARAKDPEAFRPGDMFRSAKTRGSVIDPRDSAQKICAILESRTEMGKTVPAW